MQNYLNSLFWFDTNNPNISYAYDSYKSFVKNTKISENIFTFNNSVYSIILLSSDCVKIICY